MFQIVHSRLWSALILIALLVSLLGATYSPSPARADSAEQESVGDERYTPIATEVTLSAMPAVGRQASVTIVVSSTHPAPGTEVNIVTSEGVRIDGESHFVVDLAADEPQTLTTAITPAVAGNHYVAANAFYALGNGNAWGDSHAAYFHSGDGSALTGFVYQGDPSSGGAEPGPGNTQQVPTPSFADGSVAAFTLAEPPAPPSDGSAPGAGFASPVVAADAGSSIISGNTGMYDRHGNWVNQRMLVELLDAGGNHLAHTYSDWNGNYTFAVSNPGQFRIRVWTYYRHTSQVRGALRVVTNGDSSDPFALSGYSYNVGPFGPFADGEVQIGSWQPSRRWEGSRAWWIYQDLFNAFFAPYYAVPPGVAEGSRMPDGSTIEWQPDSTNGTFFAFVDERVHLLGVDAFSPHTVIHEYGHNVMWNVYNEDFPPLGCGTEHFMHLAESTFCGWTEGWADFYAMLITNDPVWKFPCFAPCTPVTIDVENRAPWVPGEAWDAGDTVEGNVAGALWDFVDHHQDGWDLTDTNTTPFWRIWDAFYTQVDDTFAEFITYMWGSHNFTNVLATLYQNTIDHGWEHCGDWYMEPDTDPWQAHWHHPDNYHPYTLSLCTDYDADYWQFYATLGNTYTIWTQNLSTGTDGTQTDTTLTLYSPNGYTELAYDDNGGDTPLASKIVFTATTEGWHYVAVRQANGKGNLGYRYDIDFSES